MQTHKLFVIAENAMCSIVFAAQNAFSFLCNYKNSEIFR